MGFVGMNLEAGIDGGSGSGGEEDGRRRWRLQLLEHGLVLCRVGVAIGLSMQRQGEKKQAKGWQVFGEAHGVATGAGFRSRGGG